MNCYSNLSTVFHTCNAIHADICQSIVSITHGFWSKVSLYLPFNLQQKQIISRIESVLVDKGYAMIRAIQSKEKKPFIPLQLRHHVEEIEPHLIALSDAFSTVFKTDVIFWTAPNVERNESLVNEFLRKLVYGNLSVSEKEAAKVGVMACFEIAKFNQKIQELFPNTDLSHDQLKKLLRTQRFDHLVKNFFKAIIHENVIENVAECCGQMIGEGPLSSFASLVKGIGRPIGRFSGLVMGLFMIQWLIRGTMHVIHRNRGEVFEKRMQMGLFALYVVLDSVGYNPMTQLFETLSEGVCEQLVAYSIPILSGYMGMWMVGTQEPLREYVINTNRSLLISSFAVPILEKVGLLLGKTGSIPLSIVGSILQKREVVGLTSGHLGYHYEFYKDCTQKAAAFCLKGYERKLLHYFFDAYVNTQPDLATNIERMSRNLQLNNRSEVLEWMIQVLTSDSLINPVPFFYRNMVQFFSLIQTSEMQILLQGYRKEIEKALDRSDSLNTLNRPIQEPFPNNLLRLEKQILHQIDQNIFGQPRAAWLATSDVFKIGPRVVKKIEEALDILHPFIPRADAKEEICFVYMIDILVKGMVYFNYMKVFNLIGAEEQGAFFEELSDVFTFLARVKDVIIDMRFPKPSDHMSLYVKSVRGAINVALHLAYPT